MSFLKERKSMSWINQGLKNILYVVLITILLVAIIELFMFGLYLATESKYFKKALDDNSNDCPASYNVTGDKLKVAIFGGSSSAGYISPISFSKLLCNSNFTNKKLVITNYAGNGQPFSDFQSEIIKTVMSDYDVIVIYAGHNEIWTQIYRRNHKTIFPNGMETSEPKVVHLNRQQELKALSQKSSSLYSILNFFTENSRIYYFLFRVTSKLNSLINEDNEGKTVHNKNFYYESSFLTGIERNNIIKLYKNNLEEISNRLSNNQKLIISTVLSNDFFPPLADVYTGIGGHNELDDINRKLKNIFAQQPDKRVDRIRDVITTLPESANRLYLEGFLCLELRDKLKIKYDIAECFSKLIEARRYDALPLRVIPEINSYIREFRHNNVIVVDPVKDIMESVDNINEYNKYFMDFQHPSLLGHLVIAKNILSALYPEKTIQNTLKIGLCGISWGNNGEIISIKSIHRFCTGQYKTNITWLDGFMKIQPVPFQYDYFRSRSEGNIKTLSQDRIQIQD